VLLLGTQGSGHCYEFTADLTILTEEPVKTNLICGPIDGPQTLAPETFYDASSLPPDATAKVVSVLVKQILDLREALEFYELQLCYAASSMSPNLPYGIRTDLYGHGHAFYQLEALHETLRPFPIPINKRALRP